MGSINLTKLQPGRSYSVVVRAVDGSGVISQNSLIYNFTVPSTNTDGTQLTSINSAVVTALAPSSSSVTGGALIAGGLDSSGAANSGALNLGSIWNNTASSIAKLTGAANAGAVIINSTGILGYQLTSTSSGQANFFLDTASGNAYFRGTVYANAGQIGGFSIDTTSLSASSIYYNNLSTYDSSFEDNWQDYWVASATMSVSAEDFKFVLFLDDSSLIPQSSLAYATVKAAAGNLPGGSRNASLSASSFKMVMYKNAASAIAFSNSDLGMTIGNSYILSAYVSKPTSASTKNSNNVYLQVNRYTASVSGTLTASWTSSITPITSSSWTRLSVVLSPSSSEYYTISIIDPDGQSNTGIGSSVDATFSVDSIQLVSGTTLSPYGYSNQVVINPSSSIPIKLSSINNDSTLTNIFSVYTDGGIFANYFNVKKQSKINDIYFGAKKITNISIGDFNSTHQNNTSGKNINIGLSTMPFHISGSNNVLIGTNAGYYLQYGSNNVVIGGYKGDAYWDGNVVISDGAGNIRIQANSSGLVTIPGSASIVGSAYLDGKITAASFVGDGSGLTGISGGSGTGSITIGSTVIPLNSTTASLAGLNYFDFTNTTSSGTIFSISTQASNQTGGTINFQTDANSSGVGGNAQGGAINIKTTSGATNNSGANGGKINIQTTSNSSNVANSGGGDINISTNKSGNTGTSGSITLSSDAGFAILANGSNVGTINNFNVGATTPGTGNFTSLTISGSSVATQIYANSASLNAYNTSSAFSVTQSNSASLNAYNSASTYTQSSAWNNTSASVRYASSAGYVPVSGLSASTITIGSTAIGLGTTTASLGGLTSLLLSATSGSTTLFSATNTVTNSTGGAIILSTTGNANGVGGSGTGGAISITTNATQTGTTAGAAGGAITINTDSAPNGAGGAYGGDISISTTKSGGGSGAAGNMSITSNNQFTIAANGSLFGTINKFNIGTTTAGTGNFTTLTATSATNGTTASYTGQVNANNLVLSSSLTATSASLSGRVTASAFSGDGSALTNLSASGINAANITSMQVLTSTTTSTTGSTFYPIFPASTQNITLKANTVYYFEGFLSVTKQASTLSGNWSIAASFTNAPQSFYWNLTFTGNSATGATLSGATNTTASALNMGTAGTAGPTQGLIKFQGFFQTNAAAGGTLQPQFAQSATPTSGNPTANAGSYFRITEQGTAYPVVSGSWGP